MEPIQFWSHDEAASRYSEHQRTSQRFIFVIFVLHNLSPNHMSLFITHVAALLWAATQVPEITVAIQSYLKTGFRRAVQVELLVITSYKWIPLSEFQKIVTTCLGTVREVQETNLSGSCRSTLLRSSETGLPRPSLRLGPERISFGRAYISLNP